MKRLLLLSLIVSSASVYAADKHEECNADDTVTAQASALLKVAEKLEADGCQKKPTINEIKAICTDIATRAKVSSSENSYYEYTYEKRIWELSCAAPEKDSEEIAKQKINKMWNKYKKDFKCDALSFGLPNGNLLKYSLSQNMPEVIETFASTYGLDINFVDPADNKNILDYVDSEIERLSKLQNSEAAVKVYRDYRASLVGLGARTSKP